MAHILIVDDEESIQDMLSLMISRAGHTIQVASNGKQAMQCLRRTKFDLVITDLFMPEQEGLETIRLIRKEHPDMKIIAMSGGASSTFPPETYLRMAKAFGVAEALAKPIQKETLLKVIETTLIKENPVDFKEEHHQG